MKKILLCGMLFIAILPYSLKAQETKNSSKTISSFIIKANNLLHFGKKPLTTYYALGGEVGMCFKDRIYLGISQYSSLAPSNIWKNNPYNPDKIRVYEYSLLIGYKFDLKSPFYVYAGIRSGYGGMYMEYRYNNGVDTDETMTREALSGVFVTPDLKLGFKLHKYISIEAGLNYRYYIGNKEKWGLSTKQMNGLGAVVSIVGNIPL